MGRAGAALSPAAESAVDTSDGDSVGTPPPTPPATAAAGCYFLLQRERQPTQARRRQPSPTAKLDAMEKIGPMALGLGMLLATAAANKELDKAIEDNNAAMVNLALKSGAKANSVDADGETPVFLDASYALSLIHI